MKPKNIPGVPQHYKGSFHDTESSKEINVAFTLCDSSGNPVQRSPIIGDYIKILLSESNKTESDDYQWVRIDMIDKSNPNRLMMQCRPSKLPGNEFAGKTVHYHSLCTTSTFVISKEKNSVKAGIYGRNEYPNLKSGFFNCIRNLMIAIGGMLGFSKIQWKCLTEGLTNFE